MSRLPHFLDNRLTDGGEVVRKISGTHLCQKLSRPQGHSAAGRIRSIEEIGNRHRRPSGLWHSACHCAVGLLEGQRRWHSDEGILERMCVQLGDSAAGKRW
jgi:hypothetical protein